MKNDIDFRKIKAMLATIQIPEEAVGYRIDYNGNLLKMLIKGGVQLHEKIGTVEAVNVDPKSKKADALGRFQYSGLELRSDENIPPGEAHLKDRAGKTLRIYKIPL